MASPQRIQIRGLHRYVPTTAVYEDTLSTLYGTEIDSEEREQIENDLAEHFEHLYLIEIEVDPPGDCVSWREITQPVAHLDRSNWQAPFDPLPLDNEQRSWVFFFHFLDTTKPLQTPVGNLPLPTVTPLPPHLAGIVYMFP